MVRQVNLDGHSLSMTMLGCQAGGASFALAYADLQARAPAAEVLARWRTLTLGNMAAAPERESSFLLAGVGPGVRVSARGKRPDGSAVAAQALWFAVRAGGSQPTTFRTGASAGLLSDVTVITGNTVNLQPDSPLPGYVAVTYNLYGITLQNGNTFVSIT
jgi:hypothetical protein